MSEKFLRILAYVGILFPFSRAKMQKILKFSLLLPIFALSICFYSTNSFSAPQKLPTSVQKALKKSHISSRQLAVSVRPLDGGKVKLNWRAAQKVSPASTEKIITTLAALETLGPNWRWRTQYLTDEPMDDGVIDGPLYIRGGGDPTYVIERLWRDLSVMKAQGLEKIRGDIVIDRTLFATDKTSVQFGEEVHRPYMKEADAALINYQAVTFHFEPDYEKGIAHITATPALKGFEAPKSVKLVASNANCVGWRHALKLNLKNEWEPTFDGGFPKSCPAKDISYIFSNPESYWQALLEPLLDEMDISWRGDVVKGVIPDKANPLYTAYSDDLVNVSRLTNKFSNNVLARHIYLTLGLIANDEKSGADYPMARSALQNWLTESVKVKPGTVYVDNGSGLSRESFVTASAMTQIIAYGWKSPRMPEWVSTFPVSATDGTMRRRQVAPGSAYIKTGLLNGVKSVAGVIQAKSGKRYAIFGVVEGERATSTDAPLDAVIQWVFLKG